MIAKYNRQNFDNSDESESENSLEDEKDDKPSNNIFEKKIKCKIIYCLLKYFSLFMNYVNKEIINFNKFIICIYNI